MAGNEELPSTLVEDKSETQRDDASAIKQVHALLRLKSQLLLREQPEGDAQQVWEEHVRNKELLQDYAQRMRRLATGKWRERSRERGAPAPDRITWIVGQCHRFFVEQDWVRIAKRLARRKAYLAVVNGDKATAGEEVKLEKNHSNPNQGERFEDKLKVLDVGSCFNPLSAHPHFDCLAIDIAPASEDVFKCDFLSVAISDHLEFGVNKEVTMLPQSSFDVIVFSLLLEYLPLPQMRYDACVRASHLLKPNGLLFIITPDSCHQSRNADIFRRWKICLSLLGLHRVYHDKLKHILCMTFLKTEAQFSCLCKDEALKEARKLELSVDDISVRDQLMLIPQDRTTSEELKKLDRVPEQDVADDTLYFDQLPCVF